MGFERIPDTDLEYGLISFDADGNERDENGRSMSQMLIERATADPITNVFFFCHGWRGDVPAARAQYNDWIKALMTSADVQLASQVFPSFRPLLVGLHWPSEPWGDEEIGGGGFAAGAGISGQALLDAYLARLGDRPEIRQPLEVIINEARRNSAPPTLPRHVREAYTALNAALALGGDGNLAESPDADRDAFDPEAAYQMTRTQGAAFGGGFDFSGLLGPLRQLSYFTMKARARTVGEGGMHTFLTRLEDATGSKQTRIHLMGHSFGTIVVSGMLGGPGGRAPLHRPVDSVVLVQGAVSLWTYSPDIPFDGVGPGYFSQILADGKIRGPLLTTRSRFDKAVGVLYPWASRFTRAVDFAGLPKYGGIGAFGIQGLPDDIRSERPMLEATEAYGFERGKVYNLDGSKFISHGDGPSGAHSDIAGPEVAHAIWEAAFGSV